MTSFKIFVLNFDLKTDDTIPDSKETNLCDYNGGPKALGIESGDITDDQISSSSAYNQQSVGPQSARFVLNSIISFEIIRSELNSKF